jgi:hypothetical protein
MRVPRKQATGVLPGGSVPAAALLLSLSILGTAGCRSFSTFSVDSRPTDQKIVVDGRSDDWSGKTYVVGDGEVSVGFMNDGEDLYICLLAQNDALREQIMAGGLIVWIDPKGGEKKTLGIKFPLGRPAKGPRERPRDDQKPRDEENEEAPGSDPPPENAPAGLEIVTSEKGAPRGYDPNEAPGIETAIEPSRGFLVYEIKIPLARSESRPYAVGAAPGEVVGIGFETGKIDRGKEPRGEDDDRPGAGGQPPMGGGAMGGGMRGRGGMGPGGGFGMEPNLPAELKIWAFVRLASGGAGKSPEIISLLN